MMAPIEAGVYKWVDENGTTHYSDTPPPGMAVEDSPAKPPASKKNAPRTTPKMPVGNVNFVLSGDVRDARGQLMAGVTMTIVERHQIPNTFEFKEKRKRQTVNGRFRIDCSGCPIHKLRFRAPGYLSEEYRIKGTPDEERFMARQLEGFLTGKKPAASIESMTIRRDNIKIVLQSEDSIVRLVRKGAQLWTARRAPFQVLAGPPNQLKQMVFSHAKEKKTVASKNGKPWATLVLTTGRMPFTFFASAGEANTLHTKDIPLYIELKDIEGGFIMATPVGTAYRKRFDSLQEAPATGYRPRLAVKPGQSEGVFFYCKIGSIYGKGEVVRPTYMKSRDTGMLRTYVTIYLNYSGSRNLKSRV